MLKLRDIMTRDVITVSPDLALRDAMELLTARHVSGAPVVSDSKVVGVVSVTDLLSFAASQPGGPTERTDQSEWGEWGNLPGWENGTEPPATYFTGMWPSTG